MVVVISVAAVILDGAVTPQGNVIRPPSSAETQAARLRRAATTAPPTVALAVEMEFVSLTMMRTVQAVPPTAAVRAVMFVTLSLELVRSVSLSVTGVNVVLISVEASAVAVSPTESVKMVAASIPAVLNVRAESVAQMAVTISVGSATRVSFVMRVGSVSRPHLNVETRPVTAKRIA